MKKVWKKAVSMTLALAMLVGLMSGLTINAAAAGSGAEVSALQTESGVTLKPQDASGKAISASGGVYAGVEKFALSFTGTANAQHVVFLLNGENNNRPTESNIRYIDQKAAASNGKVEMTIYPDALPGGQYAVYTSAASGFKLLATFEVKSTAPEVEDMKTGASYSFNGQTLNVQYTTACAVLVEHADGTYTRLTAKANASGGYDFDISAVQSGEKIVIALKGDINGDGKLTNADFTRLNAILHGKVTPTGVGALIADINESNSLTNADFTRLNAVLHGKVAFAW